jgi:putative inorganic carbon (hco3(-)) transporter
MMWVGSRPKVVQAWDEQGDSDPEADHIEMDLIEMDFEALDARVEEGRAIAMTLLLSLIGFFIAAFFLSRSYVIILYLFAALVVAHYADLRRDDPDLPRFALGEDALLWPVVGLGSAIFLYIVVKVLLVMQ